MSVCPFTVFLALLGNHCYSFHRTKWRLVTSICRGPGPVATKMSFFFAEIQIRCKFFSSSPRRKPLLPLWEIGSKKIHNFPIKSSHLCRTSRHVWLSSSTCDQCCASLCSWRYCVGARLKFWRRSRVPKKGSRSISRGFAARDGSAVKSHSTILQRLRRQISLDYYTIPPATQATVALSN